MTAAESKASYEEIKDYVLEHMGLKVSSLNIAQAKRNVILLREETITCRNEEFQIAEMPSREREGGKGVVQFRSEVYV